MDVRAGPATRALGVGAENVVVGDEMVEAGLLGGQRVPPDAFRARADLEVGEDDTDLHGMIVSIPPPVVQGGRDGFPNHRGDGAALREPPMGA